MPGGRLTFSPITSIMNSVNPNPLRPVGVTTGVIVMPLAINVPPLPSEMPCRISQVAPVTTVFSRLSDKRRDTVHQPHGSLNASSSLLYSPLPSEVFSSLASPLTPLKSPLYQSGPEPPGVRSEERRVGKECRGGGSGDPGKKVVPFTSIEK